MIVFPLRARWPGAPGVASSNELNVSNRMARDPQHIRSWPLGAGSGRKAPIARVVGLTAAIVACFSGTIAPPVSAKAPGNVHCYGRVCHRVLTVDEVKQRIGNRFLTQTSFYDIPARDRFNAGTITSSGEPFDADSPHRVASSIYPDGTELLLWNPKTGKASHVRVNDFGPFWGSRTLDVTRRIAEDLGFVHSGVTHLLVVVVAAPSPAEARYRKNRRYGSSYGLIGRFGADEIEDLASDLIDDAGAQRAEAQVADAAPLAPAAPAVGKGGTPSAHPKIAASTKNMPQVLAMPREPAAPVAPPAQAIAARTIPDSIVVALAPQAPFASSPAFVGATIHASSERDLTPARSLGAAIAEPVRVAIGSTEPEVGAKSTPIGLGTLGAPNLVYLSSLPGIMRDWVQWPSRGAASLTALVLLLLSFLVLAREFFDRQGRRPQKAAIGRSMRTSLVEHPDAMEPSLRDVPPNDTTRHRDFGNTEVASERAADGRGTELGQMARTARRAHAEGDLSAAERTWTSIVARLELQHGPDSIALIEPLTAWADCARDQARHNDAASIYSRALDLAVRLPDVRSSQVADILDARALLRLRMREPQAAWQDAADALQMRSRDGSAAFAADADGGVTLSILGEAYRLAGDLPSAEQAHRQALGEFLRHDGATGMRTAGSMTSLARVLLALGNASEAKALLMQALPLLESRLGLRHPGVAQSQAALADVHDAQGDIAEAVRLRRQSLEILGGVEGPMHPDVVEARQRLAALIPSS